MRKILPSVMPKVLPIVRCWPLWYAVVLLCMPLLLLAQPATQPAEKEKKRDRVMEPAMPMDGVVRLPDGREINLQELAAQGGGMVMVRADGGDGHRDLTITEDDRVITINESDEEIVVTVKEGDAEPTEYRAPNAEELEKNHPEAYELYQKYSEGMMMALPQPGAAQGGQQFRVAMGGRHGRMPMMGGRQIESLGATVMPVFDQFVRAQLGEGVMVIKVAKDSAAERVGLERHDLIKSVNGNEVKSVEELEEAVDGADKLAIEIVRAGKATKLEG